MGSDLRIILDNAKTRLAMWAPTVPTGWLDPDSQPRLLCLGAREDRTVAPGTGEWGCIARFQLTVSDVMDYPALLSMTSLMVAKIEQNTFGSESPARVKSVTINPWNADRPDDNRAVILFEVDAALGSEEPLAEVYPVQEIRAWTGTDPDGGSEPGEYDRIWESE